MYSWYATTAYVNQILVQRNIMSNRALLAFYYEWIANRINYNRDVTACAQAQFDLLSLHITRRNFMSRMAAGNSRSGQSHTTEQYACNRTHTEPALPVHLSVHLQSTVRRYMTADHCALRDTSSERRLISALSTERHKQKQVDLSALHRAT